MIKYKGFPVAPAEVESLLLEHPAVRDCGVVAKPDFDAGEIPCAFVVLSEGFMPSGVLAIELRDFVADRLSRHKQPREVRVVEVVPRTPSGKILRRERRKTFSCTGRAVPRPRHESYGGATGVSPVQPDRRFPVETRIAASPTAA